MTQVDNYDIRFRIFDGTDIARGSYASSTTIAYIRQRLFEDWPQDRSVLPKSANDLTIIHAGRVLEDNATLAESRIVLGDPSENGVQITTMHVVVQPGAKKKIVKKPQPNQNSCSCHIL